MKIYAIKDNTVGKDKNLAFFFYYENINECCIEINEGFDEWQLPFVLESFVRRGALSVDEYHTRLFISLRVIPSDRQNIGMILKDNGLSEYDEIKLFILSDGRCAQDDCYIKPIDNEDLPDAIKSRISHRIMASINCTNADYLVTFADGTCGIFETDTQVVNHPELIKRGHPQGGGSSLAFSEKCHISSETIYNSCAKLPFEIAQLHALTEKSYLTVPDVCETLGCTRQNINDLIKRGRLSPVQDGERRLLFSKSDIIDRF